MNETNEKQERTADGSPGAEGMSESQSSALAEESSSEKDEINRLLDEGYSVKQIIDLGFNRRTAYHYAKKRMKPENEPASGGDIATASPAGKAKYDLLKLGSKDVIPPEAVLEVLHLPQNGDAVEVWRRGVLDGVGFLLLGARYAQLTAAGQADVVKNQLDVMREAKGSTSDIIRETAETTGLEMGKLIIQRMPKPEPVSRDPNMAERMLGPMVDMAGKQMANLFGKMFGLTPDGQADGGKAQVPSGWEYETKGGNG